MGAASAAVTLAAGPLYEHLGAAAFWVMAAMCAVALPVALGLNVPAEPGERLKK
jgi:PPP family 3-phenylpropionic acid transporter